MHSLAAHSRRRNTSRCGRRTHHRGRRGMSLLYVTLILAVVFGFASFAMDYGRVQLAKTQLQIATDVAAKWGVQWVSGGNNMALTRANEAAADNKVDGQVPVFTAGNVHVGSWNAQTRVFTPGGSPRNAVRLQASAVIPLALGSAVGKESVTVRASAVARCVPMAIVGLDGIDFKNNTIIASYDSSVMTHPTPGNSNDNGAILSNGDILGMNNATVKGDVYYGPSGSVSYGGTTTGAQQQLSSNILAPAEPAWTPSGNPGGLPQNYTNNTNNTVLPGGTYWFTSLTVNRALSFAGPATIYVNGNIDLNADVSAFGNRPANLKIYQIGANRRFDAATNLTAQIVAPRSAFTTKNNFVFRGTCIFETITVMNNCQFYFDESTGAVQSVALVQ